MEKCVLFSPVGNQYVPCHRKNIILTKSNILIDISELLSFQRLATKNKQTKNVKKYKNFALHWWLYLYNSLSAGLLCKALRT